MTLMDDATGVSSAEKDSLIELAQSGDRNAFAALFQCYHARICTYLGRLVENEEIGRDLAQETFVEVRLHFQLPLRRLLRSRELKQRASGYKTATANGVLLGFLNRKCTRSPYP